MKRCVTVLTPRSKATAPGGSRVGVAERDGDLSLEQSPDQLDRPGKLGREGDEADRPGHEQALEQREIGVAARIGGMHAQPSGRDEGPLEVRAEDPSARCVARISTRAATSCSPGDVMNVGRNAVTPVSCERPAGPPESVDVGVEEVDPARSRSPGGRRILAPQCRVPRRKTDLRDDAIDDLDVPSNPLAAYDRCLDTKPHVAILASSGYTRRTDAGWSSLVARRAHNPEVAGSNPAPATGKAPETGLFRSLDRDRRVELLPNFCLWPRRSVRSCLVRASRFKQEYARAGGRRFSRSPVA